MKRLGAAIDIGTTIITAELVDLGTGAAAGRMLRFNPQAGHGADIISRIKYSTEKKDGLKKLNTEAVGVVKTMVLELCGRAKVSGKEIYKYTVAGNPVMLHLFLGVSPETMGRAPFEPAFREGRKIKLSETCFPGRPDGYLYTFPIVSGFIGGDIVAGLLASGLSTGEEAKLFIDLGTNGEMVIGERGRLFGCSVACGPAFEGYGISMGMPAVEGAIAGIENDGEEIKLKVLGGKMPKGICGSGLIDLLSVMLEKKVLTATGRIETQDQVFRITDGISITQADVRKLQLSKSAVRTGIEILLEKYKTGPDEILLGGSFGCSLNTKNAAAIGLIPGFDPDNIKFLGNTAIEGAKMVLRDERYEEACENIASKVEDLELAGTKVFYEKFIDNINFIGGRVNQWS